MFDKLQFNMLNSFSAAFRMLHESYVRSDSFVIPDTRNDSLTWVSQAMESMKINFDGSFCSDSLSGGVGVVIKD